jgi:hypothetical protein
MTQKYGLQTLISLQRESQVYRPGKTKTPLDIYRQLGYKNKRLAL